MYAMIGIFGILAIRLDDMQIINGAEYAQRSRENHIVQKNILPTRGLILDRNGEPLVENVGIYSAKILPEVLPESKESRYRIYLKLQEVAGVSPLEVQARVDEAEEAGRGYIEITVATNLDRYLSLALEGALVDLPGGRLGFTPVLKAVSGSALSVSGPVQRQ